MPAIGVDPRSSSSGVVVNFHGIGTPPRGVPSEEVPYWCPTKEWELIVSALGVASREGANVEITFDDGNLSDVEVALPALVEHDLTATFHACAGRLGEPGYLDEGALLKLREAGMSIGSHGWHHVDSRTLSTEELIRAVRGSRDRISEACGSPVETFALPLGSYDRRVLGHVRRHYPTVYTSDTTSKVLGSWIVPRWSYVRGWTEGTVIDLTHGKEPPHHRLRQRAAMLVKRWR